MPDLKQYWKEIRAIENGLPDCVWLVSVDNPSRGQVGGSVVEAASALAAKLIHSRSHRLATSEEAEAYQVREQEAKRTAFHSRLRRQGISVVPVATQTLAKED